MDSAARERELAVPCQEPERSSLADGAPATFRPEPGSIWGGGGSTVRVIEVLDTTPHVSADVRVERLTGRMGLMKRPSKPQVISLTDFEKFMRPLDLTRNDAWTRAIKERFA